MKKSILIMHQGNEEVVWTPSEDQGQGLEVTGNFDVEAPETETASSISGSSASKSDKTSASVEVTISNYLDVEAPENEVAPSASELSVETEAASSDSGSSGHKSNGTLSTAASSGCHVSNKSKFSLAERYAISVATQPKRHLYATLLVSAILTLVALVGAVLTGQTVNTSPHWSTRGTLISGRTIQLYHLDQIQNQEDESQFSDDGEKIDINSPPSSDIVCSGGWYGSPFMTEAKQLNLVTAWKTQDDSQNVLDSEALYQMCMNEEHVLQTLEENDLCYKCPIEGGRQERCIQPYSLVAAARFYLQGLSASVWALDLSPDIYLAPSLSCKDLRAEWTKAVQARFTKDLLDCTNSLLEQYELKESESNSAMCSLPDAHMVASLVDVKFARSGRVEYTSSIYASKQDTASLDELYKLDKSGAFAQEGDALTGLYEVGIQPLWNSSDGGFYMRDFLKGFGLDVALAAAGCIAAGSFIFWHTKSLYLTLFGLLQITLALPISWVLYRFVLGLESFPVLNIAGLFIVFSLGADDVFVMVDKWRGFRNSMNPASTTEDVAIVSIPNAIKATLMTSFTTSTAFFALNVSDVACIRLFGIFCGLLVAVDYVLSVLLLSPVLCLYDSMMNDSPSLFVSIQKKQAEHEEASMAVGTQRNLGDKILGTYIDFLYSFRWPALLLSGCTMIACSFVASTFKTPDNEPFPAPLSKTNRYEIHSKTVENLVAFPLKLATNPQWAGKAVFGVQAADNENHLDPDSWYSDSLVYDEDFVAANNQLYLLEFCDKIVKPTKDYSCVLQEFDLWLQLQSQSSSPDDQYIKYCNRAAAIPVLSGFDQCLNAFSELTNHTSVKYDGGKVKAITIDTRFDSTPWSPRSEINEDWQTMEDWSAAERFRAPEGANNFFVTSGTFWYLDTFNSVITSALKSSYIVISCAALVILLSSRSVTLSLLSGISVLYVLVAATATLAGMGWRLGLFESILFAVLVGLGSDFILHFAHAYSMIPGKASKRIRMKHAILHMGPSVLGSAATTLSTALIMQFCQITTNTKFSTIIIMTMVHSLIGSFFVFSVLCSCFGPAEPTKRFDAIKNKVVSHFHKRNEVQTRSEGVLPKSIEIATDTDVNNRSTFRPKHWMIVFSYLAVAAIVICISFGAASFVKASQEPQIVESAFAADDPVLIVDGDGDDKLDEIVSMVSGGAVIELIQYFKDRIDAANLDATTIVLALFETMKEAIDELHDAMAASNGSSQEFQDTVADWELATAVEMLSELKGEVIESFKNDSFDFAHMLQKFEKLKEVIDDLHNTVTVSERFQFIVASWEIALEYLRLFVDCGSESGKKKCHYSRKSRKSQRSRRSPLATAEESHLELPAFIKNATIEEIINLPIDIDSDKSDEIVSILTEAVTESTEYFKNRTDAANFGTELEKFDSMKDAIVELITASVKGSDSVEIQSTVADWNSTTAVEMMSLLTEEVMEYFTDRTDKADFDLAIMLETFATIKKVIVELLTNITASVGDSDNQEFQETMFTWESAVVGYIGLFNDCAKDIAIGAESVDSDLLELLQERCHDSMQSSPATATAEGSRLKLQDVKNTLAAIEEVVKRPLPQPYPEGERWLCIFSNVAEGQDDCPSVLDLNRDDHSALMLYDSTETYPLSYYSLRPDGNPFDPSYGPGLDRNPFKSDLRVNYYQDVYTHSAYPYRYCKSIDTQQYAKFVHEMEKDWWWTGFFNSASFARKVFGRVTGIHVDSDDWAALGSSTPCKVGKAIIELSNSTGQLAPDFPPE